MLSAFLGAVALPENKLTTFVTHVSPVIQKYFDEGKIARGIHPNFLENSSHGNDFVTVIENCLKFAPEAEAFRSHRLFDVTDITHLLRDKYGFKYVSNLGTVMQTNIFPILHESGLIHFPIFFEDGTHLYNKLDLSLSRYKENFLSPGIKIISIHPMNYVINTPEIAYMRNIKDSLSRKEYANLSDIQIATYSHKGLGIRDLVDEIINLAKGYKILSLSELYFQAIA